MKIVREYINEKFTEESDPVHDMSIGIQTFRMETNVTIIGNKDKGYLIDKRRANQRQFVDYLKKHNITYKVIKPKGPEFGGFIIDYRGTKNDIIKMLQDRFLFIENEIEMVMRQSKKLKGE